jgi:hypothetical protein
MRVQESLVCSRCQPLEAKVAEMENALRSLSNEQADTAEELAGARSTTRLLERQKRALQAEITKHHETSPDAQKITSYLETWRRISGKKRADISLESDRAKLVRTMSKRFQWPDLEDALKGAGLVRYMAYGRRVAATARGAELALELKQIIGKSQYVEENRDNYRRAQAKSDTERMWEAMEARHAEYLSYADVVLEGLMRRDAPELVVLLDDLEKDLVPA